jgi:hypothetical protein
MKSVHLFSVAPLTACGRVLLNAAISLIGLVLFLAAGPVAKAQNSIFAITSAGEFGTLNLSTGTFTKIGDSGKVLAGLAGTGTGGNLYGAVNVGSTLYRVNLANGALVTVGSGTPGVEFADFGGTTTGLYGIDTSFNLYSVATNGTDTLIGTTGLSNSGLSGMSSGGSALYATVTSGSDSILYSIDTTTGAAAIVGDTGVGSISGLVFIKGKLYATSTNLYTLDLKTGKATLVANTGQQIYGMGLPPCILEDGLSYNKTNNTLTMNFTVGNNVATTWNAWLTGQNTMTQLFSTSQPITVPPTPSQQTTTLSPEGTIGVLSTLTTTNNGIVCSSWEQINTGKP